MKDKLKYIIAMILLFCVSFVGGCVVADARTAEAIGKERMSYIDSDSNFSIYKDNKTGVHYLVYNQVQHKLSGAAMCVMVDADGKPLVDKVGK